MREVVLQVQHYKPDDKDTFIARQFWDLHNQSVQVLAQKGFFRRIHLLHGLALARGSKDPRMSYEDMGKEITCVSRLFLVTCLGSYSLSTPHYWRRTRLGVLF